MIIRETEDERFPLQNLVGRNVECEDGILRRIVNITHSFQYPWLVIINEGDPDEVTGYFVHALTAARLLHGQAPPNREEKEAFTRLIKKTDGAHAQNLEKAITRPKFKLELD